jgi:hypothetical protein
MLFGFLAYQQANAQLYRFLAAMSNNSDEVSSYSAKSDLKERLEEYFVIHNSQHGVRQLSIRELDRWNYSIDDIYDQNFKILQKQEFFLDLHTGLQRRLLYHIMKDELKCFKVLFGIKSSHNTLINSHLADELVSQIECQVIDDPRILVRAGSEFKNFYMVKKGTINCFTPDFQYLTTYEQGGFFGEYNILFGLKSQLTYQPPTLKDRTNIVLYVVDQADLLQVVVKDELIFEHMHRLSV